MAISTTGDVAKRGKRGARKRNRIRPPFGNSHASLRVRERGSEGCKEDNKEVTVHIPQVELQLLPSVRHSKFRWHARPPRSRKVLIILRAFSLPTLWECGRPRSSREWTSPSACAYRLQRLWRCTRGTRAGAARSKQLLRWSRAHVSSSWPLLLLGEALGAHAHQRAPSSACLSSGGAC